MNLSIMLDHEHNMGDHGEYRKIPFEHRPGETVEALVQRIADATGAYVPVGQPKALLRGDVIEIRMVAASNEEE